MTTGFQFRKIDQEDDLFDYVYGFSALENISGISNGVIIPNGRVDLHLYKTKGGEFCISLVGLETKPKSMREDEITTLFSISFNPLGIEYILQRDIAGILNHGEKLSPDFWDYRESDLDDFSAFCEKSLSMIVSLIPGKTDPRKKQLFDLIFQTNGEMGVRGISQRINWGERQINQYFNNQFGLSLKAYCNILRFQASLAHINSGQLFPQLNYYDQSHFIKEIKRLSGASPKELFKNENNRFLQFLHFNSK